MNKFRSAILSGNGLHSGDPLVRSKNRRGAVEDDLSSVKVPRSERRTANQREDDRHRLDQECARARFGDKLYDVELINLSGGGAMIEAEFQARLWDRVDLILGEDGEIECAVRWLRGDRIGLEFAHETRIDCAPEQRDALLLDVLRRSFPDVSLPKRENDSGPVKKAEPAATAATPDSRRTERRHPLVWTGEILFSHSREKVRLRNISAKGALIESSVPYPVGVELLLILNDGSQYFATVSWSCGDKAGLRFEEQFDLSKLGNAKPEVAPKQMIRAAPGLRSTDTDNPWADGWQRSSLEELRADLEGFLKR